MLIKPHSFWEVDRASVELFPFIRLPVNVVAGYSGSIAGWMWRWFPSRHSSNGRARLQSINIRRSAPAAAESFEQVGLKADQHWLDGLRNVSLVA